MGSKRRHFCNVVPWSYIYLSIVLMLVILFSGVTQKDRTSNIADDSIVLDLYGDGTYSGKEETVNEYTEVNITGKLPEWQNRSLLNAEEVTDTNLLSFRQIMTQEEYGVLMGLVRTLKQVSEENGLTYMLCGGSLLGAYRHGGFVPWDDDIDVWMDFKEVEKARRILNNTADIMLYQSAYTKTLWKMSNISRNVDLHRPNQDPRFPYIDIYFFTGNSTHIYDVEVPLREITSVLTEDIFPLRTAVFEDEEFRVPNNMETVLQKMYGPSETCTSHDFTHLFYIEIENVVSIPCEKLFSYYPFITRSYYNGTVTETLKFINKTIRRSVSRVGVSDNKAV